MDRTEIVKVLDEMIGYGDKRVSHDSDGNYLLSTPNGVYCYSVEGELLSGRDEEHALEILDEELQALIESEIDTDLEDRLGKVSPSLHGRGVSY